MRARRRQGHPMQRTALFCLLLEEPNGHYLLSLLFLLCCRWHSVCACVADLVMPRVSIASPARVHARM